MTHSEIYSSVREEILFNHGKQDTYVESAYVVTTAVWAISFSVNNGWIMLTSLPVLFLVCLRIADCRRSIAFLTSYLSVLLEGNTPNEYEISVKKYYKSHKRSIWDQFTYHGSRLDIILLSALSILVFWYMCGEKLALDRHIVTILLSIFIQTVVLSLEIIIHIRCSDLNKMILLFEKEWKSSLSNIKKHE